MGAWTTGLTALAAVLLAASTARAGASKEQMAFADDVIVQMKASSQSVRVRLGAARGTRDVVRTACLNDKLTQLEGVQRRAEDARSDLRRASLREDMDAIAAAAASMSRLDARAMIGMCP